MARLRGMSCLALLNCMVLLGCMVSYMLRVNLAITIVVMPDSAEYKQALANMTSCTTNSTSCPADSIDNSTCTTPTCSNNVTTLNESSYTYSPWKQNMIQGSFFWGYILTEVPGGRLAEVIGSRKVIGFSVLLASILTSLTPVISDFTGYYGLLVLRLLQGLALGAIFPSLYPLAAKWIPPMDRGKFMSHLLALSLGAAITYPMCGLLISLLGWRSVFYVTGSLGFLWTAGWFRFVYDSPASHPRISAKEKLRLDSLIGTSASNKVFAVPWRKLMTSGPVWAIIITHTCVFMNYSTLAIQMPSFIDHVFRIDIKKIGFFSSLPHLGKYAMGLLTGYLTSYILTKGDMSLKNTRRTFIVISVGLPGILMLIQAHTGYMMGWSIFNLSLSLTLNGAVTGGHLCGGLDIAPNFSGTIFGLANTLGSAGSSLSAYFVGHMTSKAQTFTQWQPVFWMLGTSYVCGLIAYLLLGSVTLQEWNMPKVKPQQRQQIYIEHRTSELKPLNLDPTAANREVNC